MTPTSNAATFLTLTTAIELPEMPKRQLADRILDEILTLRRPRSLVLELDEHAGRRRRGRTRCCETAFRRRRAGN